MENEENKGLIVKKAFEDQWADLVNVSLVSSVLELSIFSLSLSYSWTEFSWSTLEECGILGVLEQEGKGREGKCKRTSGINSYNGFSLQVSSCVYLFLTSFGMHGICMWFVGFDLSLAWRMVGIDS